MTLHISSVFTYDEDAGTYIQAVETADGQALESATRKAINNFVIGCKQDGIWSAIKASCILAGARTLSGALVPLAGTAPTNNGPFVAGDYNRKTGLVGNASTKYLDSGRNNNTDPQNNKHLSVYLQSAGSIVGNTFQAYISAYDPNGSENGSEIARSGVTPTNTLAAINAIIATVSSGGAQGFYGCSRSSPTSQTFRVASTDNIQSVTSVSPLNQNILVFARPLPSLSGFSNARIAFYSIGEALDLAKLDGRVTDLITAFGAAIP